MQELLIEPGRTEKNYWSDLWRYRELFYVLAWRDISVRYKQTAIGVIWAILRPFLAMVIFTVVFARIAKMPSHGIPYPILVFGAMLPWQFFANSLSEASNISGPSLGRCTSRWPSGTPSVTICGGYESPRGLEHLAGVKSTTNIILSSDLLCSLCWLREPCPIGLKCLTSISPAQVEKAIAGVLGARGEKYSSSSAQKNET